MQHQCVQAVQHGRRSNRSTDCLLRPGLGTRWRKFSGNTFGLGISHNVRECYEFIFDNYQAGDGVYLFGFSRGAFTVRSLAGFIELFGILPKSKRELIKKAYEIYRGRNPKRREKKADEFLAKHQTMKCRIRFLGVWDTVGALGLPFPRASAFVDRLPWLQHKFHATEVC